MSDALTPKRRGRKPLDKNDPSVSVSVTMTSARFEDLRGRAQREHVSVPERIRRDLRDVATDRKPLIVSS